MPNRRATLNAYSAGIETVRLYGARLDCNACAGSDEQLALFVGSDRRSFAGVVCQRRTKNAEKSLTSQ